MNWQTFYQVCFGIGLVFSLVSFLLGAFHFHLPVKWHLPGLAHGQGLGHGQGHAGVRGSGVGARAGGTAGEAAPHGAFHFPIFNSASLMVFLAWFGGVGYLLMTRSRMMSVAVLGFATVAGVAGAALITTFLVNVLDTPDAALEDIDYQMVGAVGTVNIAIRGAGTGEIIYVQGGTRRSAGARSDDGRALQKGTEVVVTRFERGIAYVRPWDEYTKED
jgi:membrane protein implicated in regulation of membrane protease activity